MMRAAVSPESPTSIVRSDFSVRSLVLFALALGLVGSVSPADGRTARDLSARMRVDGYASEFLSGDEEIFGLNPAGVAEEARDDSKWQNNEVYQIRITWDAANLYVAVEGKIWGNNLVLLFDSMPGRGLSSMTDLNSWKRNVDFDTFGRFPGDEFMPDVFAGTWDTNTQGPRFLTQVSGNQVDDQVVGEEFSGAATFDGGNDGRAMELAIPWRNVFAALGGGGTRDIPVVIDGVPDTLPGLPVGVRSIKVAAFVTAGWDGSGGPDSAPDNLRGHTDQGGDKIVLDNYASIELDRNDDTGLGLGGPDGVPDWDVSPRERVTFRYQPPITAVRFSIGDLSLDRPAFRPDLGDGMRFFVRLDPPLDPDEPIDLARRAVFSANVYDASGRWVRNLFLNKNVQAINASEELNASGLARWDGRDETGRRVEPGIYILRVTIEPNLDRATRALVVVR